MNVIKQSYAVLSRPSAIEARILIEACGRTAYKSESRGDENSMAVFIDGIVKRGHLSVIEHVSMTVRFVTDRGVSHEIVRHRIASFTQESTRYCNYSKDKFGNQITVVKPVWFDDSCLGEWATEEDQLYSLDGSVPTVENINWLIAMVESEKSYFNLLNMVKQSPQQARSVLPNSLKTEIIVTCNFREWRHIFQLRAVDAAAHPQMRDLMIPLYQEMREYMPEIFDLGEPK